MIKEFAVAIEDYKNNRNHFQTLVVFTFSGILALSASQLTSVDVKEVSDIDQILGEALVTVRGQKPVEDVRYGGVQSLIGLAETKEQPERVVNQPKQELVINQPKTEFVVNDVKKKVKKRMTPARFQLKLKQFTQGVHDLKAKNNRARLENLVPIPKAKMNDSDQRIRDMLDE